MSYRPHPSRLLQSISLAFSIGICAVSFQLNAQRVLTVGGALQDVFIRYKIHPTTTTTGGKKIDIKNPSDTSTIGGGAINTAISFSRLGYTTSTFSKIGNDDRGQFLIKKLQSEGVITDTIIMSQSEGTGISYIMPAIDGNTSVLIYRGANEFLKTEDIPQAALKQSNILYITSLNGESSDILLPLVKIAHENKVCVVVNPGSEQLKGGVVKFNQSLPYIDILLLNETEAQYFMTSLIQQQPELKKLLNQSQQPLTNDNPPLIQAPLKTPDGSFMLSQFFKLVHAMGPKIVMVTNGADGAYVSTGQEIFYHAAIPTNVITTIGAGDAFGSCFVATLMKNTTFDKAIADKERIKQALRNGVINSTSVVSFLDANKALLNSEELEEYAQSTKMSLVQEFTFTP